MLLATESDRIRGEEREGSVHVRYGDRRWMFPREDCVLLPIANTTAELLGRYIGQRLLEVLRREKNYEPRALRAEGEGSFGQIATDHWGPGTGPSTGNAAAGQHHPGRPCHSFS